MNSLHGDLLELGTAKGGPDRQPEDANLGGLEAPEQGPVCNLSGGAVTPCHTVVEPESTQHFTLRQRTRHWRIRTPDMRSAHSCYHVGWQVLRSVTTVMKGTLRCRLCHLRTHSGICCISG
jgi:hypothetical protein